MATEKQIRANRRNARRSTGPRTPAGKDRSRFNALRYGLAAQSPVLPHENAAAFHETRAALIEHYRPAIQELQLIDHVAHVQLRMERSRRFENRMFDLQLRHTRQGYRKSPEPRTDDDTGIAACMCSPEFELGYQVLFRYDSRAESQYFKAVNALHRIREARLRREQAEAKRARHAAAARTPAPAAAGPLVPSPAPAHAAANATENPPEPADTTGQTPKLASFGQTAPSSRAERVERGRPHRHVADTDS